MIQQRLKSRRMKLLAVFPIFFSLLLLQSCNTTKYTFSTSSIVPAAEGSVKVKSDKNNNYTIDLDVMRLAEPQRLNPAKATYVVWMQTEKNGNKNIGQLKTASGTFSSTLRSSLKTVSTFEPIGFFITAEEIANIQFPAGQTVLSTNSL